MITQQMLHVWCQSLMIATRWLARAARWPAGNNPLALNVAASLRQRSTKSPGVLRTASTRRKGACRGGTGGLRARRLDPLSRRSGQSHGHERHLQDRFNRLCEEIDEKDAWPYLWIDATYLKVDESGRIVSAAVIVAQFA
jgi:hypothetical protein